jgi:hypothetical protein
VRYFNKSLHVHGSDLAIGDRFASEVILDSDNFGRETWSKAGRDYHQQGTQSLAVATSNQRHTGQEHVGEFRRIFFPGDDTTLFDLADDQGTASLFNWRFGAWEDQDL